MKFSGIACAFVFLVVLAIGCAKVVRKAEGENAENQVLASGTSSRSIYTDRNLEIRLDSPAMQWWLLFKSEKEMEVSLGEHSHGMAGLPAELEVLYLTQDSVLLLFYGSYYSIDNYFETIDGEVVDIKNEIVTSVLSDEVASISQDSNTAERSIRVHKFSNQRIMGLPKYIDFNLRYHVQETDSVYQFKYELDISNSNRSKYLLAR